MVILFDLGRPLRCADLSVLGRCLPLWFLLLLLYLLYLLRSTEVLDAAKDQIGAVDLCDRHDDIHHLTVAVCIPNGGKQEFLLSGSFAELLVLLRGHGKLAHIAGLSQHLRKVDLSGNRLVVLRQRHAQRQHIFEGGAAQSDSYLAAR